MSLLKEDVYEHCDKSTNVVLRSKPFLTKNLLSHAKTRKLVLTFSIKRKDDIPNYCNLRIRLCQNRKKDSTKKLITHALLTAW